MNLADFTTLVTRIAANDAVMINAIDALPDTIRNDWWAFSTRTRCEYGAQGVPALHDEVRERSLPMGVRVLTGAVPHDLRQGIVNLSTSVPVDFLFEDTREQAKDAYRTLCADLGFPYKADEQMADYEATYTPMDKGTASNRAKWLELAADAGIVVPPIPTEFFTRLTRAEFDAAVIAVETLAADQDMLRAAVAPALVVEWNQTGERIRAEVGIDETSTSQVFVRFSPIDDDLFGEDVANVARKIVGVPLGFLVDETREEFLDAYRSACELVLAAQRDKDSAERRRIEAALTETARRSYFDLGRRLGLIDEKDRLTY